MHLPGQLGHSTTSAMPAFDEHPPPPIDFLQMHVIPDEKTPGHVPSGFVQMEDQMGRTYLVPDFMVESLKSAARGNKLRESIVEEAIEVRFQAYLLVFPLLTLLTGTGSNHGISTAP